MSKLVALVSEELKNNKPLELILPEAVIWPEPLNKSEPVIIAWSGVFTWSIKSDPEYGKPTPSPTFKAWLAVIAKLELSAWLEEIA